MAENQLAMVSDWMVNGNINDFVKAHPDTNRVKLVRLRSTFSISEPIEDRII